MYLWQRGRGGSQWGLRAQQAPPPRWTAIPGLTRTCALGEKGPTFADLYSAPALGRQCTLEIHDVHRTSDASYQVWLAGRSDPAGIGSAVPAPTQTWSFPLSAAV